MIGIVHSSTRKHIDADILAEYDFENSGRSRNGKNNASIVGAVLYPSSPAIGFQGGASWAHVNGAGIRFTYPNTVINKTAGSAEFVVNVGAYYAGGMNLLRIGSNLYSRHLEFYFYGGNIYYYSNSAVGYNDPWMAITVGTTYYIGVTWDATNVKVYGSTAPNFPSITPTKTYNSPRLDLASSITAVEMVSSTQADPSPNQKFDRVIFSNKVRTKFPTV